MFKLSLKKYIKYYFLFPLLFVCSLVWPSFGQDIKEMERNLFFPGNLPVPRFILPLSDTLKGVSLVFEDLHAITPEKLEKLGKIHLVEIQFSNQMEFENLVLLLPKFPEIKYLVLNDFRFRSPLTKDTIKIPEIISTYRNIEAVKFKGNWLIDYNQGFSILKKLPKLQYLYFENYKNLIPASILQLQNLRGLSLSNRANEVPEWIENLKNMESIALNLYAPQRKDSFAPDYFQAFQKFQKLPKLKSIFITSFGKNEGDFSTFSFKNLEKVSITSLDISKNQGIVAFITNHKKLKYLELGGYNINEIDERFSKLKMLETLKFRGRKQPLSFNLDINALSKLRILELNGFSISSNTTFPIGLTHLNLVENKVNEFPTKIFNLSELISLNLSYDSLRSIPPGISMLSKLENLNLSYNSIQNLPPDLNQLKNLKNLNLETNPITTLGERVKGLDNLEKLQVAYGNLKNIPEDIGSLSNLKHLDIKENYIEYLPESITQLNKLIILDLDNNYLKVLPQNLGDLSALEVLRASNNYLNKLPNNIAALKNLKEIYLNNNELDNFPIQLSTIQSLKEIWIGSPSLYDLNTVRKQSRRGTYRKDNPNLNKPLVTQKFKDFPANLSQWKSLNKLVLGGNTQIDKESLFKGLFTIPSTSYSVVLNNIDVDFLPENGWENFFAKSIDLSGNKIASIPYNMVKAPYLNAISLSKNKLSSSPINLNQNIANSLQKYIWFMELGLLDKNFDLPKTDSMVFALIDRGSFHFFYSKNYGSTIDYYEKATRINDSLANARISKNIIGESYYQIGKYQEAINYLTKHLQKDTVGPLRIMNTILPAFDFLAKSYLKLGDTLNAIETYKTLARDFGEKWGVLAMLYKESGQLKDSQNAIDSAIKNHQNWIDFGKFNDKSSLEEHKISILEYLVIKEDFEEAYKRSLIYDKEILKKDNRVLFEFLKICAEIGKGSFDLTTKSKSIAYFKTNNKPINNWSYGLFYKWLSLTKINAEKAKLIREFADAISK